MKRASGVFQPSCFTFVSETHQTSCIADCELHTNWMNVKQTIFARTIYSPCFFFGSTDSLFQALSKWERAKRKENRQGLAFLYAFFFFTKWEPGTDYSACARCCHFKRPLPRPFFPRRTAKREITVDCRDPIVNLVKRRLWNLTHVYYFSRETLLIRN